MNTATWPMSTPASRMATLVLTISKRLVNADAAEAWFAENDPEALPLQI